MARGSIALLKQSVGNVVRLTRADGEVIVAKVTLVDSLEEEIVLRHALQFMNEPGALF
jgi:hypothetical protein